MQEKQYQILWKKWGLTYAQDWDQVRGLRGPSCSGKGSQLKAKRRRRMWEDRKEVRRLGLMCWVHAELNTHSLNGHCGRTEHLTQSLPIRSSQSQHRRQICTKLITTKIIKFCRRICSKYYGENRGRKTKFSLGKVEESFAKGKTVEPALKIFFQIKMGVGRGCERGINKKKKDFPKTRITWGKANRCNSDGSVGLETVTKAQNSGSIRGAWMVKSEK